jgi:3-methyladenine DNA glycosylase/8-oxoguanine DNA glycosylase
MSAGEQTPVIDTHVHLDFEVDPAMTLAELRHGPRDPTIRFERGVVWRSSRHLHGPATVRISPAKGGGWRVMVWGSGASAAFDSVPRLLGSEDDPSQLQIEQPRLRELAARSVGMRLGRSDAVWASLLPAIIGQKVTAIEAQRAYFGMARRYGEAAPGPGGLRLTPRPDLIASLPYYELHPLGLEQRRAVTVIRAAQRAAWLEETTTMAPAAALARLRSIPGIGPWTAAETARTALGDPDAVSLGDFHIPNMVCWALAGEPRGDDTRMLELLEPYRGQRARVVRILEHSGISAPKYGPRTKPRDIRGI